MKKKICIIICFLLAVLLGACQRGEELKTDEQYVYYVNTEGTGLIRKPYKCKAKKPEQKIGEVLAEMRESEDVVEYKPAFPEELKVADYQLSKGELKLYFGGEYSGMDKAREVLLRAAVVQSLVQISGVDYVEFYIDGAPLTDSNGNVVGFMQEEDFVQSIGPALNSYHLATLKLYYSNEKGDHLKEETVSVRYNSNMSMEKLIVEQLIKGPSSKDAGPTLPPDTKLLGISVKDGICYVNFNEGFLEEGYDIDPKLVIYSIVNSITEGGTAGQVQISVNGETNVVFQGAWDLSKPISRDLDLVEETKK